MTTERLLELHRILETRVRHLELALKTLGDLAGHNTDAANARIAQLNATIADVQDALGEHLAGT